MNQHGTMTLFSLLELH